MAAYDYTKDDPYSPFYEEEEGYPLSQSEGDLYPMPASQGVSPVSPGSSFSMFSPSYKYSGYGEEPKKTAVAAPGQERESGIRTVSSYRLAPVGSTTTTTSGFSGAMPEMGATPQFNAPEYSESEVRKLTHKAAAPGVRRLRQAVQAAMSKQYENPNVKRMTLRQALAGYGLGLEGVMAGASQQARGEYGEKYGKEFQAAQMQHGTDVSAMMAKYNAAMQAYLASATKTATTELKYG